METDRCPRCRLPLDEAARAAALDAAHAPEHWICSECLMIVPRRYPYDVPRQLPRIGGAERRFLSRSPDAPYGIAASYNPNTGLLRLMVWERTWNVVQLLRVSFAEFCRRLGVTADDLRPRKP